MVIYYNQAYMGEGQQGHLAQTSGLKEPQVYTYLI
jgi:hypothetical protein